MNIYKVVEKFVSINGEAQSAGELAVFIRFAGCNLNCGYCDTKWANDKNVSYEEMTEEDIKNYILSTGVTNVTLTGGEPLIQSHIEELLKTLSKENLRVEIETNGSVSIKPFVNISNKIIFTLDYKLPGSGMESFMMVDNYKYIQEKDTIKFVISTEEDMEKARKIIEDYSLVEKAKVYLSSAFSTMKPEDIVNYMVKHNMNKVRLQLQMHKYIWDPDRKGV